MFMSAFEFQILFNFQNGVHALAHQSLKFFIVSLTQAPKYWKASTASSTIPCSIDFRCWIYVFHQYCCFIDAYQQSNPFSCVWLSCFWTFLDSSSNKLMSSTYYRTPNFFLRSKYSETSKSMFEFFITQSMATIKRHGTTTSPCNLPMFTLLFPQSCHHLLLLNSCFDTE